MNNKSPGQVPEGWEFLRLLECHQNLCVEESRNNLSKLKSPVQQTTTNIGTLLSLLDRLASCFWGCHEGHHVVEHLVGRSVSYAAASFRLTNMGHYDEAWALTRIIAEIGNLMWLFFIVPEELERWVLASDCERKSNYTPFAVRKKIEDTGNIVPHNKDEYSIMCKVGAHPNPKNAPQARYNTHGIPTLGGIYQERGFIESLTQLAWAIATVGGPAAKMVNISSKYEMRIIDLVTTLVTQLPGVREETEITKCSQAILSQTKWLDQNLRGKK